MKTCSGYKAVLLALVTGVIASGVSCRTGRTNPHSPYDTEADRQFIEAQYNKFLENWPGPYTSEMIPTSLGLTHVLINGPEDGIPVILFHGAMANALMWKDVVGALQETHRTIAVDIVGHFGQSIPTKSSIDDEELVLWVDEILDHMAVDQVVVIGTSFGGWLAMRYSMVASDRIRKLVLIATAPSSPKFSFRFIAKSARMMARPTDENVEALVAYMLAPGAQPEQGMVEFMRESLLRGSPIMPKPSGFRKGDLAVVTQPVLVLAGEYDRLFEPEKVEEISKKHFSSVQVITIGDAGHFLFYEQPKLVNEHILRFLGQEEEEDDSQDLP